MRKRLVVLLVIVVALGAGSVAAFAASAAAPTPAKQVFSWRMQTHHPPNSTIGESSDMFANLQVAQSLFTAFGFLALFMGGFIIFNTFRTIVAERRHDIGMLRAIGANRSTIMGLIISEGLLQGIIGTAIGIGIGYLMGVGLIAMMSNVMRQFLNLRIGAPVVEPGLLVVSIVLGVGVTLIAGLFTVVALVAVPKLAPELASYVQFNRRLKIR